jgi:hypothetical protein
MDPHVADPIETIAAEFGGDDDKINRLCIKKIQRVGSELVFDTVSKTGWADQVQRCRPMQTHPEQPIETGKSDPCAYAIRMRG